MTYVFGVLVTLTFINQLASVFFVFKKVESTTNGHYRFFQVQFLGTWGFIFSLIYRQGITAEPLVAGMGSLVILSCMGVFFYCSSLIRKNKLSIVFSKDSPEFHISKGPYSFVRHPFYASYIGTYLAIAAVMQNWILTALTAMMFGTYYFAARIEEKKFLNSELKESYRNYMNKTGMFFPKLSSAFKRTDASYSKVS